MVRVIDLFAGIGAPIQALKNIGIEYEIVAFSEIDRYASEAYQYLHGQCENLGDVSKINPDIIPDCDLLCFGFPCQDISIAGAQLGLSEGSNTRSSLLWECKKIIEAKKPKFLMMENVKNLVGNTHKANFEKWLAYLETLGYKNYWKVLNAVDYGAPQSRERVFCISILNTDSDESNFTFPSPQPRKLKLKDILDDPEDVPNNMWMNDKPYIPRDVVKESDNGLIWVGNLDFKANEAIKRVYDIEGVCPTLTTMGGGHRQPKIKLENGVRKLTPKECWRVMGFSENDFEKVKNKFSNTQLYKMAGNSIAVPCLEAIFKELFNQK